MTLATTEQMKTAIVGVAVQLPSGDPTCDDLGYRSFWKFLVEKRQAHQPLSPSLFDSSEFGALQEKMNLPARGGFLKNHDTIDSVAFGLSAKDSRVMPFTTRRLMELSFEAHSDSGIDYRKQKIGCFMSGTSNFEVSGAISMEGSFASIPSAPANRISYVLGITGPSVQLDTACSSSLTALHLAILAMEAGDCSGAIVGAAQINREVAEWKNYCLGGVLSSDGLTKPFDTRADGFGRGEGASVVVLKPLEDALRDNDHIYAVILGSAINSTGSLMPLNVPSAVAQKECIQTAYARAGRAITDVDFAELHITGTSVGDPIEANAAGEIFGRSEYLDVGSVKGNLGHLESAAFLVSLLKACLILEEKIIPPTVNLSDPSPAIHWDTNRLRVPTEATPLDCRSASGRSIISLSGAGIGGSTGHVVVESPPESHAVAAQIAGDFVVAVVVGGLSPRAVAHICQSLRDADLSRIEDMRSCAVTMSRRARQLPWRTYLTLPLLADTEILPATLVPTSPPTIAFIFSGQGPQNLHMGRGLFSSFPVFRSTILELDEVYHRIIGVSLLETTGLFVSLASPPCISLSSTGWPVTITVAAIAMLQMALFDLLVSVGITPTSFAGHSAGETAILYTSGAGPKAMALEIAIARGQAMTVTESEDLGMASLACDADKAAKIISQIGVGEGRVEISCFNSPDSVALSGSASSLGKAIAVAQSQGIFAQRIRTMVPGHSSYMDTIKHDYLTRMTDIFARYPGPHTPTVPVFSTCTGHVLVDEFSPAYFWENCRNPVLFSPAITNLLASYVDNPIFLEISCHPVLSFSICRHGVPEKSTLCPMQRSASQGPESQGEATLFTETLARMSILGYNSCDLSNLYGPSDYKPSFLDHPWVYRAIPPPRTHFSDVRLARTVNELLSSNLLINEQTHPRLAQHVINGEPILPATGFIEILLEAGANVLWDVEFLSLYPLSARNSSSMILERSGCNWSLKSSNISPAVSDHARGLMDSYIPVKPSGPLMLQSIWDRLPRLEMEGFYQSLHPFATFGPAYRRVIRCHGGPSELIAQIQGPSPDESSADYRLDPVALDACLHIMLHPAISKQSGIEAAYLPSRLGRFVHYPGVFTGDWFSHVRRRGWYPDSKSYDVVITDASGTVICEFHDLVVQRLSVHPPVIRRRLDLTFQPVSLPVTVMDDLPTYSHRDRHQDEEALYATLDSLALRMISKSFQQDIVVGDDISRQRYFEFAKHALQTRTIQAFDISDSEIRSKYPAHFEVTSRIEAVHHTVFRSSKSAVDALYSDGLMTRFYSRSSQTSTVYPEAVGSFSSLLDSLRSAGKRAINILEVGAGTGLLTRYLVEVLQQHPDLLAEYTVTDVSYALAAELSRTIQYDKITPKVYDLTKDASHQGFRLESYDVIVALQVLHAVPDIRSCLSSLQNLLVPGGIIFVIELDGTSWDGKVGSVWHDCVFGSFSEWFGFTDGRTHCTMPSSAWMEMLNDLGFVNRHAIVDGGHTFLFTAQKPSSLGSPTVLQDPSTKNSDRVLQFSLGHETELRTHLSTMDPTESLHLCIVAAEGRDGDSAMGLCATLGNEFPFWVIHLAIFERGTHLSNPLHLLSKHHDLFERGERVVYFPGEGSPCVLRAVLSNPPATIDDHHPNPLPCDHLLVNIISFQTTHTSVHGFVGRVMTSRHRAFSLGDVVVGITDQKKANTLVVHLGCIVALDPERQSHQLPQPEDVLKLATTGLIRDCLPKRLRLSHSLIVTVDETMSEILATDFGVVALVERDFRNVNHSRRLDLLISDSPTAAQYPHIRQWVPRSGQFILWDVVLRDNIQDRTWEIAHVLKLSLHRLPCRPPQGSSGPSTEISFSPLFRHDKSYIVLGGIGGLGVDLAVWMYQHGARYIVLTSRRGIASLDPEGDVDALSKIEYLQNCEQLELRLAKSDATDAEATSRLVTSLSCPVGGCFQLTLVLSDRLFVNQTQDEFAAPHDAKLRVFEIFTAVVEIDTLEFYVAFSSLSGIVGYVGQSNYASACTVLEGALSAYHNAFSLVVPAIRDAGYLDRANSGRTETVDDRILLASISASELWTCLEDGLRKIRDGPSFTRYVPDLDWDLLHGLYSLPPAFHHLLSPDRQSIELRTKGYKGEEDILEIVLSAVEVDKDDFDSERPLLSYGLDSLSATRLSATLQPFVRVSQMQLLAGITWAELRGSLLQTGDDGPTVANTDHRMAREIAMTMLGTEEPDFDENVSLVSYGLDSISASKLATALRPYLPTVTQLQLMGHMTWAELVTHTQTAVNTPRTTGRDNLAPKADTIVEICSGPGLPLILFPGVTGRLGPLLALRAHFHGALWGVQVTESTPIAPFMMHAAFVMHKIREKQPTGPYRLGAFSAAGVMAIAVAKLLEDNGQEVVQLSFIDGFPLVWVAEDKELFLREQQLPVILDKVVASAIDLFRYDPLYGPDSEEIRQFEAALAGSPEATETHLETIAAMRRIAHPLVQFLCDFYGPGTQRSASFFADAFTFWVSSLKAPFTVLIAEFGTIAAMPDASRKTWEDLGVHRCLSRKDVKHRLITGVGHWGILGDARAAALLQSWQGID